MKRMLAVLGAALIAVVSITLFTRVSTAPDFSVGMFWFLLAFDLGVAIGAVTQVRQP